MIHNNSAYICVYILCSLTRGHSLQSVVGEVFFFSKRRHISDKMDLKNLNYLVCRMPPFTVSCDCIFCIIRSLLLMHIHEGCVSMLLLVEVELI